MSDVIGDEQQQQPPTASDALGGDQAPQSQDAPVVTGADLEEQRQRVQEARQILAEENATLQNMESAARGDGGPMSGGALPGTTAGSARGLPRHLIDTMADPADVARGHAALDAAEALDVPEHVQVIRQLGITAADTDVEAAERAMNAVGGLSKPS